MVYNCGWKMVYCSVITTSYDRKTTQTVDLEYPLPNRIFTLAPSTLSILLALADDQIQGHGAIFRLCRKFSIIKSNMDNISTSYEACGTVATLSDGRLTIQGSNLCGGCLASTAWTHTAQWVRLPPVLKVWGGYGSWFASTTQGLYAWGKLAREGCPQACSGVSDVQHVRCYPELAFIRTAGGSMVFKGVGQVCPLKRPGEEDTVDMISSGGVVLAMTRAAVYRLSMTGEDWDRLPLPPGSVKTFRVEDGAAFIVMKDGVCVASGWNYHHRLLSGDLGGWLDLTPVMPGTTVTDVRTADGSTVVLTEGAIVCAGANGGRHMSPAPGPVCPPVPLAGPQVRRVYLAIEALIVVDTAGSVYTRGSNEYGRLGVGSTAPFVSSFTHVALEGALKAVGTVTNFRDLVFITTAGVFAAGYNGSGELVPGGPEAVCRPALVARWGFERDSIVFLDALEA